VDPPVGMQGWDDDDDTIPARIFIVGEKSVSDICFAVIVGFVVVFWESWLEK
jgi:hypothetical protein